MTLKRTFLFAVLCLFTHAALFAQTKKLTWKEIQNSSEYLYGKGTGKTRKQASDAALEDLVSQISTQVQTSFDMVSTTLNVNNEVTSEERAQQAVRTYSSVSLKNAETLEISKQGAPEVTIVRYVSKADIQKMFDDRKDKIIRLAESGMRAKRKGKIGTALQSFFGAYSMLANHPDGDKITMKDEDYNEQVLSVWLPQHIKQELNNVSIKVVKTSEDEDGENIEFDVTYNNAPAADLTFSVKANDIESDKVVVNNGKGSAIMPSKTNAKKLVCSIDYRGDYDAAYDRELADALSATDQKAYAEASKKVDYGLSKSTTTTFAQKVESPVPATAAVHYLTPQEASPYIPVAEKIYKALSKRDFNTLSAMCTPEGKDDVKRLLNYGNAKLINSNNNIQVLDNNGDITLRSFPMTFTFSGSGKRKITENVVFHINTQGQITQVAFALEKQAADDIFNNEGNWGDVMKQTIVNFLETYKTAFAMKDFDLIDKLFSDDALIIVGRKIETAPKAQVSDADRQRYSFKENSPKFKYTTLTKAEYMKNLEACFRSNEYVNIKFDETRIRLRGGLQGSNQPVYGIQLKQDYFSSTYGDTGYLFLAVDFKDPKSPLIHIRTWQPTADTKGDDVIGIEDFD